MQFELSLFWGIITINICRQYVPCEGNSSYKFYIFRWFLISFSGIITINICRQYVPCEGNSSYKFYIIRWFLISLKNLGGGHKFSEFACCFLY